MSWFWRFAAWVAGGWPVREIALHIMDLVENSIRAQATVIAVTLEADPADDRLRIIIEDNGTGLKVPPAQVLDPFYTTKGGKRTGLGLSLFKAAAEAAGGTLTIDKGRIADTGVRVTVEMKLSHVDRTPLGDLAGTLAAVVCTHPEIDFRFDLRLGERTWDVRVAELAREFGHGNPLKLARQVQARLAAALQESQVSM